MKRISTARLVGAIALGLLGGASVFAGARIAPVVFIDDNIRFASGSLGGAHNTADRVQHIGCTVSVQVTCIARNSAGKTRTCATPDAFMVANARAIKSDSIVSFTWNTNGACLSVVVENTSYSPPKLVP